MSWHDGLRLKPIGTAPMNLLRMLHAACFEKDYTGRGNVIITVKFF